MTRKILLILGLVAGALSLPAASSSPSVAGETGYRLGGITPVVLGGILENTDIPPTRYLVVRSSGGIVHLADELGQKLGNVTCVVDYAASAALQLILPGCKERYYLPWGKIQFHSAHVGVSGAVNMWWAQEAASRLEEANLLMIGRMLGSGLNITKDALYLHLMFETYADGDSITEVLGDWIRPISECAHCPLSWQKLTPSDEQLDL